eukprot:CAMPEP_0172602146 /NCGR_PEP_ID=MMETSP1068-20121228/22361_1 /TAXON_ID=35684 /ORGANISM="Pseudopedinella elastica, Strain CCMP716" /LENGTH=363 /DNA_ID=CAMNT_0013403425 /DNA_START=15 /DNA_END=1106 /DNA_ORIENTATION=-
MARTSFISMENFVQYVQPWLPDFVVRWIVWLYLAYFVQRIRRLDHPFKELRTVKRIMSDSKDKFERVADKTEAANEQHYEVPTEFFTSHLGPCRKYSSCEWAGCGTLAEAETLTFDSYLAKMEIDAVQAGGKVLEIGCGWGSFLLYAASKNPRLEFVGFSNSATQRAYITSEAQRRGLTNVTALRVDINDFCESGLPGAEAKLKFDRIFSCECLEHSKDYARCFEAMANVLRDEGKCFVQILCHREYTYFMNNDDWMGRNFFTGGTIPSTKLFLFFTEHLVVDESWYLSGSLYARTLDAWLSAMHASRRKIKQVFAANGYKSPTYEFQKWRMFYLMSSVSFGFNGGNEWMVAYYTMSKRNKKD